MVHSIVQPDIPDDAVLPPDNLCGKAEGKVIPFSFLLFIFQHHILI